MGVLAQLRVPIVQAPMAGGPSTPALTAAVGDAGGVGFLAAGYITPARLRADIEETRTLTGAPFGVNVFVGSGEAADRAQVASYARRLAAEAQAAGVQLGDPRFDDDAFDDKLAILCEAKVAAVSFTFGLPTQTAIDELHSVGSEVWLTVTSPQEGLGAAELGADALIVQGSEAGGHRGVFVDDGDVGDLTLLAALQLVRAAVDLPLVAAGAIMSGAAVAAVLAAGASAAQVGTAYLRTPEAGTSQAQRAATATDAPTMLTRAFTGRLARGIVNRLGREQSDIAPHAYPEVHHLTAPLRAHGRQVGDPEIINLWAGQAHRLAPELPAGELTTRLAQGAREAIAAAAQRLGAGEGAVS